VPNDLAHFEEAEVLRVVMVVMVVMMRVVSEG
jgi:hypothetical protein